MMDQAGIKELPNGYEFGQKTLQDFEHIRITDTKQVKQPRYIVTLNDAPIGINGEITGISGESKSGKTAIENQIISCCLSFDGTCIDSVENLQAIPNTNNEAVIHVDTEQPEHKHQYNLKTILKRAGLTNCPDHYLSYNLRKLPLNEYFETLSDICETAFSEFNGIHSIFVDGGADFITDTNDPEQSNSAIKYFEELAIKYDTAVFLIVHTNPGGTKERGHFGSQLQRKAGTLLTVINEGEYSYIEPKLLRYAGSTDIPKLKFHWDHSKGYHVGDGILDNTVKNELKIQKKNSETWAVCSKIFTAQSSYDYQTVVEKIQKFKACGERTAKPEFTQMKLQGMIQQGDDQLWRINLNYK